MRTIVFKNKGLLSLIDLTTMGDSNKREDSTKIGKFDSGLKYALALLHRNKIDFEIWSGNINFTVENTTIFDEITSKTKDVMVIVEKTQLDEPDEATCKYCEEIIIGESSNSSHYQCEGTYCNQALEQHIPIKTTRHITGFSPQLGYNWELWQAFRELYANTLDENGTVDFKSEHTYPKRGVKDETAFIIYPNTLVEDIINHWDDYFLPAKLEPIYSDYGISIYKNPNHTLKLYKQGILIYKSDTKSRYIYSWDNAKIDERRILIDLYEFKSKITSTIEYCNNEKFLEDFMSNNDLDMFEHNLVFYSVSSDTLIKVANRLYKENKLYISKNFKDAISSHEKSDIGILKLRHTNNYDYGRIDVEPIVYNAPVEVQKEIKETFEDKVLKIAKNFNIGVEYPIIEAKISGFTVMADSFRKVLFVSDTFQEENLWELVKAIYSLHKDKDAIYKDYIQLNQQK